MTYLIHNTRDETIYVYINYREKCIIIPTNIWIPLDSMKTPFLFVITKFTRHNPVLSAKNTNCIQRMHTWHVIFTEWTSRNGFERTQNALAIVSWDFLFYNVASFKWTQNDIAIYVIMNEVQSNTNQNEEVKIAHFLRNEMWKDNFLTIQKMNRTLIKVLCL